MMRGVIFGIMLAAWSVGDTLAQIEGDSSGGGSFGPDPFGCDGGGVFGGGETANLTSCSEEQIAAAGCNVSVLPGLSAFVRRLESAWVMMYDWLDAGHGILHCGRRRGKVTCV